MGPFRKNAFYLLVWRAILAALIAIVLMATNALTIGTALLVGAHIALLFSLALLVWADRLDEERIVNTGAWRLLVPRERPAGLGGRRWARGCLEEIGLRFAKAASAVAIALATSALVFVSE